MDILQIGAQLVASKLGMDESKVGVIMSALGNLLGKGTGGNVDIGSLVSNMMQSGGLQSMVGSWLGDGGNDPVSGDQITQIFGQEKIDSFAAELGIDAPTAVDGLTEALPQMIDKSSSGGSLLDAVGGVEGLAGMAKKFF